MSTADVLAAMVPWVVGSLVAWAVLIYRFGEDWGAPGGCLLLICIIGSCLSILVALIAFLIPGWHWIMEAIKGIGPIQVEVHVK